MESTCIIWCGKKIDVIYMVGPSIDHKPKNLSKCKNKLTRLAIHQCFRLHAIGLNESRDWIFLCKNWGISERYSPVFKTARFAKTISRIINTTASIWRECSDKFVLRLFLFLKAHGLLLGTDIWASCFPDKWRLLFIYYINNRHIPDFSIQFVAFWAVTSCRTFISRYQLPTTFTQPSQTGLLYSGYSAAMHEMVCTNFPCASLWMSSMRWRFASGLSVSSPDLEAVTLTEDCGFGWTSLRFVIARLSTKIDEHASKVQYTFLERENFLTNLRNWTIAPKNKETSCDISYIIKLVFCSGASKKEKENKDKMAEM